VQHFDFDNRHPICARRLAFAGLLAGLDEDDLVEANSCVVQELSKSLAHLKSL